MDKADFFLTEDQFIALQHFLPKAFFLKKQRFIAKRHVNQSTDNGPSKYEHLTSFTSNQSPFQEINTTNLKSYSSKQNSLCSSSNKNQRVKFKQTEDQKDCGRKGIEMKLKNLCEKTLNQIEEKKSSFIFLQPVDPIALEIPEYFTFIKNPMDLQTMRNKVSKEKYAEFSDFQKDLDQIVCNCLTFNEGNDYFIKIAQKFSQDYNQIIKKNQQQIKNLSIQIERWKEMTKNEQDSLELETSKPQILIKLKSKSEKKKKKDFDKKQQAKLTQLSSPIDNLTEKQNPKNQPKISSIKKIKIHSLEYSTSKQQVSQDKTEKMKGKTKDPKAKMEDKEQEPESPKSKQDTYEKMPKQLDKQQKLNLVYRIKDLEASKRDKFFTIIKLPKGDKLNFNLLEDSKILEIQEKLNEFMKVKKSK